MTRVEILEEIDKAYDEIYYLMNDSYERNQFNSNYFKPKFKKWFAQKLDELEKKLLNTSFSHSK